MGLHHWLWWNQWGDSLCDCRSRGWGVCFQAFRFLWWGLYSVQRLEKTGRDSMPTYWVRLWRQCVENRYDRYQFWWSGWSSPSNLVYIAPFQLNSLKWIWIRFLTMPQVVGAFFNLKKLSVVGSFFWNLNILIILLSIPVHIMLPYLNERNQLHILSQESNFVTL